MSVSSVQEDVALPAVAPAEERPAVATAIACRALDLLGAGLALLLLSPVFLVVAIAIRLESGGPVLFRQKRIGRGLGRFTILKFRTMTSGTPVAVHRDYVLGLIQGEDPGPEEGGPFYKLRADDRITKAGRFLRRFSLDELPQLVNVLRGDMSLVGPRPPIPYEVDVYPPHWLRRFSVKPGMTGLWQVSGRNELNYDEMVEIDLDYAQRRSVWLNLRILAKTPWVVAHGKGSA